MLPGQHNTVYPFLQNGNVDIYKQARSAASQL
jgi:hypothetical protein